MMTIDDYRKKPCPVCGQYGIYMEPSSGEFRCKFCRSSGFRLEEKPKPTKATPVVQQPNVPQPPAGTPLQDIVEEYYVDERGNRHKIATIYAPKPRFQKQEQFDPDGFWPKVAKTRFADQIARRKRLNRDIIRRARERNQVSEPWSEKWEAARGPLPITVADVILNSVRESARRQRRKQEQEG